MAKLTKASFAAAKRRLGIKKVTKKNIGRIAKAARRGGGKSKSRPTRRVKTSRKRKRKSNPKGGNRKMGKNTQATLFKLIRLGSLVGPGIVRASSVASAEGRPLLSARPITEGILSYAGLQDGKFNGQVLASAWTPFIAANVATHLIPKINGLIRRL